MDKQRIVERAACALDGDYNKLPQWWREELEVDAENALNAVRYFELLEAVRTTVLQQCNQCKKADCEDCVLLELRNILIAIYPLLWKPKAGVSDE